MPLIDDRLFRGVESLIALGENGGFLVRQTTCGSRIGAKRLDLSDLLAEFLGLFVELPRSLVNFALAMGQLLRPQTELFLKGLARFLRLAQCAIAFLDCAGRTQRVPGLRRVARLAL